MKDYQTAYNLANKMYEEGFICKRTYKIILETLFCDIMEVDIKVFIDLDNKNKKEEDKDGIY